MQCPTCPTLLLTLEVGPLELDECPRCLGMWFDKGELQGLLTRALDATRNLQQRYLPPTGEEQVPNRAACPRCVSGRLVPREEGGHQLAGCARCGGAWIPGTLLSYILSVEDLPEDAAELVAAEPPVAVKSPLPRGEGQGEGVARSSPLPRGEGQGEGVARRSPLGEGKGEGLPAAAHVIAVSAAPADFIPSAPISGRSAPAAVARGASQPSSSAVGYGVASAVALGASAGPARASGSSSKAPAGTCIACDRGFRAVQHAGQDFHRCDWCEGLFFPRGGLPAFLAHQPKAWRPPLNAAAPEPEGRRPCPGCDGLMAPMKWQSQPVRVWACETCWSTYVSAEGVRRFVEPEKYQDPTSSGGAAAMWKAFDRFTEWLTTPRPNPSHRFRYLRGGRY